MKSLLYDKLREYGKSDYYGFHMPGHKRNVELLEMENPFSFDITEIEGFDNLHNPKGIIKEEMEKAKEIYKSQKTFFLVNGSTGGNMAAISAVAGIGDKIIIGRNSHKSIYNVIELLKLKVSYLYPEMIEGTDIFGEYSLKETRKIIDNNQDAKAIVITSPTYEGVVSDIGKICNIAHEYGIPVIVDSAHGAHFILSDKFPKTALQSGADMVIEGLHKTLPTLTQTAILHFNSKIVSLKRVEKYLAVYQTSSPSYVLMASITNCMDFIYCNGREMADDFLNRIEIFYDKMKYLRNLTILNKSHVKSYDFDRSKIVIMVKNYIISGVELKEMLNKKYHLEMEMAAGNYVLAMTSVLDKEGGFLRLENALIEIDKELDNIIKIRNKNYRLHGVEGGKSNIYSVRNRKIYEIFEVATCNEYDGEPVIIREDKINISASYIYLYPPGIPIVVPGEEISDKLEKTLEQYKTVGFEIVIN